MYAFCISYSSLATQPRKNFIHITHFLIKELLGFLQIKVWYANISHPLQQHFISFLTLISRTSSPPSHHVNHFSSASYRVKQCKEVQNRVPFIPFVSIPDLCICLSGLHGTQANAKPFAAGMFNEKLADTAAAAIVHRDLLFSPVRFAFEPLHTIINTGRHTRRAYFTCHDDLLSRSPYSFVPFVPTLSVCTCVLILPPARLARQLRKNILRV